MFAQIACALASAVCLFAEPATDESKAPRELQGHWKLVAIEVEGGTVDVPDPEPTLRIHGAKLMYGEQELALITGESAQGPYPLDLCFNEPDKIYEGICTLDERELKICFNSRRTGLKERPESFSLDGHPERRLLSFERVKPEEIKPSPGFVGMALRFDDEKKEVVVVSVLEHSPAMAAELRKDDVLVAIGGAGPGGLREAVAAVRRAKPGDQLKLRVRRDGKEEELSIKVGMFPLGLLLELG